MEQKVNVDDVWRMFVTLRRLYLNQQGTDNLWCLRDEERTSLEFIKGAIGEKLLRENITKEV